VAKTELDNKIMMQLSNHHKKVADVSKKTVSIDVQMLTLFITSLIIIN
jgi:transcriptional regulator of met regulon